MFSLVSWAILKLFMIFKFLWVDIRRLVVTLGDSCGFSVKLVFV